MNGYFLTDKGQVRNHNEDAGGLFINNNQQTLAVVADGMGGHRAGDVASEMATSNLHKTWQTATRMDSPDKAEEWLQQAIAQVNETIFSHSEQNDDCKGMGTTVVAAICTSEFVSIAHIGDSRCYLANQYGFKQVTEDHSLVNELVRSGQITREDAEQHPRKNVLLKALGTERNVTVDTHSLEWEKGDILLLCSDGLTNKLDDNELYELVKNSQEPENVAEKLVHVANDRGGEDNITLVLVHYDSPGGKVVDHNAE
ncbi:Stp1/IreP family PP2C-type Ser/Thr phosphatase [Thalassobacillus pellis]|uniref:Stp1/IreP family PP2C-type Ser/Thr phosphatase n=1 Tax=Thalassobacillus pellis TaxID=748008 RepID=UPI0019612BC8|nr:Stp1/IreP family PP2C-type Ser/Thr phosphatase [Thalassobacillus pellis]MBM7552810.1 protein phosphatase [Thalassobacillus pellis]